MAPICGCLDVSSGFIEPVSILVCIGVDMVDLQVFLTQVAGIVLSSVRGELITLDICVSRETLRLYI